MTRYAIVSLVHEELRYLTRAGFFSKDIQDALLFDDKDEAYIHAMACDSLRNHLFMIMEILQHNQVA